jgi:hypothetical protein
MSKNKNKIHSEPQLYDESIFLAATQSKSKSQKADRCSNSSCTIGSSKSTLKSLDAINFDQTSFTQIMVNQIYKVWHFVQVWQLVIGKRLL